VLAIDVALLDGDAPHMVGMHHQKHYLPANLEVGQIAIALPGRFKKPKDPLALHL
jgi:hypothetical protein